VDNRAQGEIARWLVVGLGNPLAGDDAIGLDIVRAAAPMTSCDLMELPLAGTRLFDLLDREGPVLFVDAVVSDAPAGTIHLLNLPDECVHPRSFTSLSTHGWNLGEVLSLRNVLGLVSPRIALLGIEVEDVSPGSLASAVLKQTSVALASILPDVVRFLAARDGSLGGLPHRFADAAAITELLALETPSLAN
jgi:hydrogenase maturation protease